MTSPRVMHEADERQNSLLIGCGSSGRNMVLSSHWKNTLTVDSSPEADLRIDRSALSAVEMESALLRSVDTPFFNRLRKRAEAVDVVFIVCGLGGFAGGTASTAVSRICRSLRKPVIASVALPFDVEGSMRRSAAGESLARLEEGSNITVPFENNIINQTMSNVRITRALEIMNRIVLSPLEEIMECAGGEYFRSLTPKRYRGIYTVTHSTGIEWEKKAAHAIATELGEHTRKLRELHLFLSMSIPSEDGAERLGGEVGRVIPECRVTVWLKNRKEEGQNRIGVLGLH